MPEFFRVMMRTDAEAEFEPWTNYPTLDVARLAARSLVNSGVAVETHILRVDENGTGTLVMPRIPREG